MCRVNPRKAKETPCWAACGRRRSEGVRRGRITSKGAPGETQQSGFGGKRRSSGESEFRPGGRNEGCGACDNATVQEQGVSKILTINLNDMAKELKIK